jgi:hypothetical protein
MQVYRNFKELPSQKYRRQETPRLSRNHPRRVRLIEQSAKEIQPALAGLVSLAPGFQPAGGMSGKRENYLHHN